MAATTRPETPSSSLHHRPPHPSNARCVLRCCVVPVLDPLPLFRHHSLVRRMRHRCQNGSKGARRLRTRPIAVRPSQGEAHLRPPALRPTAGNRSKTSSSRCRDTMVCSATSKSSSLRLPAREPIPHVVHSSPVNQALALGVDYPMKAVCPQVPVSQTLALGVDHPMKADCPQVPVNQALASAAVKVERWPRVSRLADFGASACFCGGES
ncbi:hypothetical protein BDZ88DRAFT_278980 [Geranomyces variabilis]|nr:hypothetical protein BDZ88DRAFT_278980 [Geranomyces variabilis]